MRISYWSSDVCSSDLPYCCRNARRVPRAGGPFFWPLSMKALIISVDLGESDYPAHAEEFAMLAKGAGAEIVGTIVARRARPDAAHFIGSGKLEEAILVADRKSTRLNSSH